MRITLNAMLMSDERSWRQSGINRYEMELIRALPDVMSSLDHLTVLAPIQPPAEILQKGITWEVSPHLTSRPPARIAWEQCALPVLHARSNNDLVHGLAFSLPPILSTPSVVTIHDLAFFKWPEQVPRLRHAWLSRTIRSSLDHATRVIAVSHQTKRDVTAIFGVEPGKIDVVPLGVTPGFHAASGDEKQRTLDRLGVRKPFILSVGNLEPRKNLPALVDAFEQVAHTIPHDLVLTGSIGWKSEQLEDMTRCSQFRNRIMLTGFVPDMDLRALYSACDAFVLPSRYEGFGLPVIEAMACGAPVLTTTGGALPETSGNAALVVQPDADGLAEGLEHMLTNTHLRTALATVGMFRAREFSWRRTAALTYRTYEKALA